MADSKCPNDPFRPFGPRCEAKECGQRNNPLCTPCFEALQLRTGARTTKDLRKILEGLVWIDPHCCEKCAEQWVERREDALVALTGYKSTVVH